MIEPHVPSAPARRFLGRVAFTTALEAQEHARRAVHAGDAGTLIGFECDPTITLGLRGTTADLTDPGDAFTRVDRGGRATLHNPGQLVIFPVTTTRGRGARAWVLALVEVTRALAVEFGQTLTWREGEPGLYSDRGKVVSLGLRLARGVSTHGLAINVRNDLADFARIRACGVTNAALDHLATHHPLEMVFARWADLFDQNLSVKSVT